MRRTSQQRLRHIGAAWLMWLVLLVPLAQVAASCHAFRHLGVNTEQRTDEPQSSHSTVCDLCLAAAAIGSGAPQAPPTALALAVMRDALPVTAIVAAWVSPPTAGYLGRAPPPSVR